MKTLLERLQAFFGEKMIADLLPIFDEREVRNISALTRAVASSKRTVGRRCQAAGIPPARDWIALAKLLKAQLALEAGTCRTSAAAARMAGYSSQYEYYAHCRKHLGRTANEIKDWSIEQVLATWAERYQVDVRDQLQVYLEADIPREMSLAGQVDVRVARALAWYIVSHTNPVKAVDDLATYAVRFEELSAGTGGDHLQAAAFVKDALAFVRDEQLQHSVLDRVLNGATAEEAMRRAG